MHWILHIHIFRWELSSPKIWSLHIIGWELPFLEASLLEAGFHSSTDKRKTTGGRLILPCLELTNSLLWTNSFHKCGLCTVFIMTWLAHMIQAPSPLYSRHKSLRMTNQYDLLNITITRQSQIIIRLGPFACCWTNSKKKNDGEPHETRSLGFHS